MSIITVSRGSFSHGRDIAQKVATRLGYECISREILLEASRQFNIPEIKLLHSVKDMPSFFERISHTPEIFVTYIQIAMLKHLQSDNIVYHGFAGHFFVKDISHVLKVRIIADFNDRVLMQMEQNNINRDEATSTLKKIDHERKKWSNYLHGMDTNNSSLYDLVINIHNLSIDDAVEIMCNTVSMDRFKTTPASQANLENLLLTAEVKSALSNFTVDLEVTAADGIVYVKPQSRAMLDPRTMEMIEDQVTSVRGVKELKFEGNLKSPHTNPFHNI